jgi:hypothetical protein
LGRFFDIAANIANADVSFITEMVTRQGLTAVFDLQGLMTQFQSFVESGEPDYYQGGLVAGLLIKKLFDFTINN